MATSYATRPSSFLGLSPVSWEAYQFDLAALTLGRWVDNKLAETDKKGNPVNRLQDLLGESKKADDASQFRSLAGMVTEKMVIPESGIW